jgi:hypothetical protein
MAITKQLQASPRCPFAPLPRLTTTSISAVNNELANAFSVWSVGINGTLISFVSPPKSKGGYGFSTTALGLIYFAPIIAIVLGELFGHYVSTFHHYPGQSIFLTPVAVQ